MSSQWNHNKNTAARQSPHTITWLHTSLHDTTTIENRTSVGHHRCSKIDHRVAMALCKSDSRPNNPCPNHPYLGRWPRAVLSHLQNSLSVITHRPKHSKEHHHRSRPQAIAGSYLCLTAPTTSRRIISRSERMSGI